MGARVPLQDAGSDAGYFNKELEPLNTLAFVFTMIRAGGFPIFFRRENRVFRTVLSRTLTLVDKYYDAELINGVWTCTERGASDSGD